MTTERRKFRITETVTYVYECDIDTDEGADASADQAEEQFLNHEDDQERFFEAVHDRAVEPIDEEVST